MPNPPVQPCPPAERMAGACRVLQELVHLSAALAGRVPGGRWSGPEAERLRELWPEFQADLERLLKTGAERGRGFGSRRRRPGG